MKAKIIYWTRGNTNSRSVAKDISAIELPDNFKRPARAVALDIDRHGEGAVKEAIEQGATRCAQNTPITAAHAGHGVCVVYPSGVTRDICATY